MNFYLCIKNLIVLIFLLYIITHSSADEWKKLKRKLIALTLLHSIRVKNIVPFPLPLPLPIVIKKVGHPIILPPKKLPVLVPKPMPYYQIIPKFVSIYPKEENEYSNENKFNQKEPNYPESESKYHHWSEQSPLDDYMTSDSLQIDDELLNLANGGQQDMLSMPSFAHQNRYRFREFQDEKPSDLYSLEEHLRNKHKFNNYYRNYGKQRFKNFRDFGFNGFNMNDNEEDDDLMMLSTEPKTKTKSDDKTVIQYHYSEKTPQNQNSGEYSQNQNFGKFPQNQNLGEYPQNQISINKNREKANLNTDLEIQNSHQYHPNQNPGIIYSPTQKLNQQNDNSDKTPLKTTLDQNLENHRMHKYDPNSNKELQNQNLDEKSQKQLINEKIDKNNKVNNKKEDQKRPDIQNKNKLNADKNPEHQNMTRTRNVDMKRSELKNTLVNRPEYQNRVKLPVHQNLEHQNLAKRLEQEYFDKRQPYHKRDNKQEIVVKRPENQYLHKKSENLILNNWRNNKNTNINKNIENKISHKRPDNQNWNNWPQKQNSYDLPQNSQKENNRPKSHNFDNLSKNVKTDVTDPKVASDKLPVITDTIKQLLTHYNKNEDNFKKYGIPQDMPSPTTEPSVTTIIKRIKLGEIRIKAQKLRELLDNHKSRDE